MMASPSDNLMFVHDPVDAAFPRKERTHEKFERLVALARNIPTVSTAVVWPCEAHALEGPVDAAKAGLIKPILVGPLSTITAVAAEAKIDIGGYRVVDVDSEEQAATAAVKLIADHEAHALMKGSLHTDILMHAAVAKEGGLRTGRRISHVFLIDAPSHANTLFITDAAINIFPDLETKRDIVQNAIDLHVGLGLGEPRVAILSAVEVINPKIPSTIDAAALCKMADRGQITGGVLDGPLAMDNAISLEAAKIKGIHSAVAGQAQVLVVPDLEAGNMLAKNLIFLAEADAAGIVLGAKAPIILTSRADGVRTRMASAAVGALFAHHLKMQRGEA